MTRAKYEGGPPPTLIVDLALRCLLPTEQFSRCKPQALSVVRSASPEPIILSWPLVDRPVVKLAVHPFFEPSRMVSILAYSWPSVKSGKRALA